MGLARLDTMMVGGGAKEEEETQDGKGKQGKTEKERPGSSIEGSAVSPKARRESRSRRPDTRCCLLGSQGPIRNRMSVLG
ncbi:hypothetical protein NDU88_001901 [Pleurodeles waltl]|uniref:Uncharacterized protein n=1 Tax=Pleurodeles waltl TaxID=8319 RepID=A0AAV7U987_PLEWA|nr:hypothetical protein NDU88_001901 [Pleurodeles waltl]